MQPDEMAEATVTPAREQRIRFLAATFRHILLVVFLIFIFAVVQMFTLWQVCKTGMKTAVSLDQQGLPALKELASLQENLALYRLYSYEYLFAQEAEKTGRAKDAETVAAQMRLELKNLRTLLPEGEGRQRAVDLENAVDDLDSQFQKVRKLTDSDFPAAMKSMDQDIPPRTERVAAAANALKEFGYQFSGAQANATFASFGWIKTNAVLFGAANSLVAFCAVMFVLLAARRSRAQLAETLARLDERSQQLQQANRALQTEVVEHQRAEESLRLLGSAVEQSKESIVITEAELDLPGPKIIFVNPAFTTMTGYPAAEAIGKTPRMLQGPHTDKTVLRRLRENLQRGEMFAGEAVNYRKDGKEFDMEWQIAPLRNAEGKITHFVAIQRDITERKRLAAQLFQSQKLETVGKLAGGFAHEFNSILTAIIGQSELLLRDLPDGGPLAKNASEISKASHRAAKLTRQLLAYGRKQFLQTEILDLNRVIAGMEGMFQNLVGGDVAVLIVPEPGLRAVKADAGQIEQVIMNMIINARDAMPNGGRLTFETANVTLDQDSVGRYPELKPGDYVMLAITDTGTGMNDQVKARIFEPFFSTKGVGEGTGLGLSTCYGIIKQSGGHISVYSEPGRGTTFKIYLPQAEVPAKISLPQLDAPELPRGTETILLVEDDPALREMAATLLRRLGYTVFAAANGVEALSLKHERRTGHIDLLFTDVVMPHMSGRELADRVRALYPHTKILFTSAYTENAIVHQGVLDKGVALLQKPFTPSALARKVREVLDQPRVPKPDDAQESSGSR
jgi:PAS domain S-box-containing protein